jgi:GT2 family glycosyltransferase
VTGRAALDDGRGGGRARVAAPGTVAERPSLPPITVVVCTHERPDELAACLDSLQAIDYPLFEVVVVDNAPSGDATRTIVERSPFRYECERRPGLDWARCRGVRVARHDIIAFTDDDTQVDPGWLRGVARALEDPAVLAMTGRVLPLELSTPAQRLYEQYGTGMCRGPDARRFVPQRMTWRELIETQAVGVGANMAFRRRAFATIGEFDTALDAGTPAGGAGDLDMFRRILRAGCEIRYEPGAIVLHRHRRAVAELERQLRANGRSFGVYLIKAARDGGADGVAAVAYALTVWLPWLGWRLLRGLFGRHPLPVSLLWAEFRGALASPAAYLRTYERDRQVRAGGEVPPAARAMDEGR